MDNNFFISCIDLHSEISYGGFLSKGEKNYKKCRILRDKMKGSLFYTNIIAATKNTRVRDQEI